MWTITGFADEAALELDDQIALLQKLNIKHVEFRSAWATKILDMSEDQLKTAKEKLDAAGISLSAVGSDLGKIQITDPFESHLERAKHGVEVAKFFGAKYIRMFSFFIPEGEDADQYRDEVMRRTKAMVELAEEADIVLLHENEKDIYGDIPRRVKDLIETIDSPNYRAIFDPANYVQCNVKPADEAYPVVKGFTEYIHVKDAKYPVNEDDLGEVVPAGEGDGQFVELFKQLKADGYAGFVSLEPHLGDFDAFGGMCGPDLWTKAYNALISVLEAADIEWK